MKLTSKQLAKKLKNKEITVEEALTYIGYMCPALLNDDNGHWALAFDGYQQVAMGKGPKTITTTFMVEKKYWKKTIRDAIIYKLNEE